VLGLSTAAGGARAGDYGALLRYLAQSGGGVELAIANAVWPIHGYALTGSFVEAMTRDFAAEVSEVDLGSAEGAEYIDGWVAEQTRGRIEKMSDALGLPDPAAATSREAGPAASIPRPRGPPPSPWLTGQRSRCR